MNPRKWRNTRRHDVRVLHCRDDGGHSHSHNCGAEKITLLNESKQCLGGAISDRYKTLLPDSCSTPTKTHGVARSLQQLLFHLLKQLPFISTTLPRFPPKQTENNLYEKTQMKTDIALRQNCDQSAKVWWSTRRCAWHWWVREWCLTLNESSNNNRTPTSTIKDVLLDWLVPFSSKPLFVTAYMMTNFAFDWWVHHWGFCRHKAHMTRPKAEVCCVMAHWIDYAGPILQWESFPQIVEIFDQNFLDIAFFYKGNCFYEKSTFILHFYISGLVHKFNAKQ